MNQKKVLFRSRIGNPKRSYEILPKIFFIRALQNFIKFFLLWIFSTSFILAPILKIEILMTLNDLYWDCRTLLQYEMFDNDYRWFNLTKDIANFNSFYFCWKIQDYESGQKRLSKSQRLANVCAFFLFIDYSFLQCLSTNVLGTFKGHYFFLKNVPKNVRLSLKRYFSVNYDIELKLVILNDSRCDSPIFSKFSKPWSKFVILLVFQRP